MTELDLVFEPDQLFYDVPMKQHTTMRVGGPADVVAFPETEEQLARALSLWPQALLLGNGSNLIVRDGGIRGLVISTSRLCAIGIEASVLHAQAGALLPAISKEALGAGLSGLEFASGIPGTVGGGCAMNAGAYGDCVADVLLRARVLINGEDLWLSRDELQMGYRTSRILREDGCVIAAEFALRPGDRAQIKAKMDDLNARRREKQPLNLPSSGSTFKRPEGHFAGALIQGAGLKGLRVGAAQVSTLHAGFVVNTGDATARDVLALIDLVQGRVLAETGVKLECEVRVVGED